MPLFFCSSGKKQNNSFAGGAYNLGAFEKATRMSPAKKQDNGLDCLTQISENNFNPNITSVKSSELYEILNCFKSLIDSLFLDVSSFDVTIS